VVPVSVFSANRGCALENAILLLIVEDEQIIRELLSVALEDDGYEVMVA
jgi:CheY-like chemotaxis protein